MPWKRSRAGAPIGRKRKYAVRGMRKRKAGVFKKRVKAIARAVVRSQADHKFIDFIDSAILSSATVPSGSGQCLEWARLTTGPFQGTTGATRVGNKIRASSAVVQWQVTNITNTAWPSANKAAYLRVALLEMRDQIDFGNVETLPGNAMFERSSTNQDLQSTTQSRMTEFWNKRQFNILSDKVYPIGCGLQADRGKGIRGVFKHNFGGQEWTFENNASENCTERRLYLVFTIDSQDSLRGATTTDEVQCRLIFNHRLNYTDS